MCVWTQERVREADAGQTRLYRFAVAALFRYSVQWLSGKPSHVWLFDEKEMKCI